MFLIRKQQFEALGDADFTRRMRQMIVDDLAAKGAALLPGAGKEIDAMIRHAMEVARGYGFETERDLSTFVLHMIRINPDFHRHPAIHAILTDPSVPTADKHQAIVADVSDEAWEEAAAMTDPDAYWQGLRASSQPKEQGR